MNASSCQLRHTLMAKDGCDDARLLQTIVGLCRVVFLCLFADGAVFFDGFNVFVGSLMIEMQHDG